MWSRSLYPPVIVCAPRLYLSSSHLFRPTLPSFLPETASSAGFLAPCPPALYEFFTPSTRPCRRAPTVPVFVLCPPLQLLQWDSLWAVNGLVPAELSAVRSRVGIKTGCYCAFLLLTARIRGQEVGPQDRIHVGPSLVLMLAWCSPERLHGAAEWCLYISQSGEKSSFDNNRSLFTWC